MTNDILNAISSALYEVFKIENIYLERVEQNFKTPSFFLTLVSEQESRLLGNRAQREVILDIQYFPKKGKEEILNIANNLYIVLRCIQLYEYNNDTVKYTDKLNGFGLHYEIVDNVLHFFVTYKPIIYYPTDVEDKMLHLTRNTEVIHGN